jgi:hypothetical protein
MSITLLKECQCVRELYDCPYHDTEYNVYLWGSWNNWSKGTKAKVKQIKTHCGEECCDHTDKYKAFLPKHLQVGVYEYKWQFVDKYTKKSFWIIDRTQEIIENEGWNTNNLYFVT